MTKKYLTILTMLCALNSFSQEIEASNLDEIILDGKIAYMNTITGEIVIDKVNNKKVTKKTTPSFDTNSLIHLVEKGETLFAISRIYGISITKLKELNSSISFSELKVNQGP